MLCSCLCKLPPANTSTFLHMWNPKTNRVVVRSGCLDGGNDAELSAESGDHLNTILEVTLHSNSTTIADYNLTHTYAGTSAQMQHTIIAMFYALPNNIR